MPAIASDPGHVKHRLIASNLADLHGDQQRDRNNVRRETVLDIKGEVIPGNQHGILTGSDPDGRAFIDGYDHTCNNWTTDAMTYPQANPNVPADRARAMLGHSDRGGQNTSWITSHLSQGCSKQAFINTGGAGSKRTQRLLAAYMATLPPNLLPSAPIFYTRGGLPGPKGGRPRSPAPTPRTRSGTTSALCAPPNFLGTSARSWISVAPVPAKLSLARRPPAVLAAKMANTIDQNKELQATYLPHQVAVVRLADAARAQGRSRLRGETKSRPKS
jgi:hypothetical protein